MSRHPITVIVGPTASGKTVHALRLAQETNGEIISIDSRQIYRGLPIGTAAPLGRWTAGVYQVEGIPYHLVDCVAPTEPFSAAMFVEQAEALIQDIEARGKTPLLAGGTGFYLSALIGGLAPLPSADAGVRAELRAIADAKGRPFLHAQLAQVDPEAAAAIPANNIHRVIRALEVHRLSGKPLSAWHREHHAERTAAQGQNRFRILGLDPGVDELRRRIDARSVAMLNGGMIEETQAALRAGIPETSPGLSGLGYPRVIAYLKNAIPKEETLRLLIQDTRQYAKRQRTWFRTQLTVEWQKLHE